MRYPHTTSWWAPIVHFLTHAVVGTAIFIIVAIPAMLLDRLVWYLKSQDMAPYTVTLLTWLEHAIVTLDVILVLAYFLYAAIKACKEFK